MTLPPAFVAAVERVLRDIAQSGEFVTVRLECRGDTDAAPRVACHIRFVKGVPHPKFVLIESQAREVPLDETLGRSA